MNIIESLKNQPQKGCCPMAQVKGANILKFQRLFILKSVVSVTLASLEDVFRQLMCVFYTYIPKNEARS